MKLVEIGLRMTLPGGLVYRKPSSSKEPRLLSAETVVSLELCLHQSPPGFPGSPPGPRVCLLHSGVSGSGGGPGLEELRGGAYRGPRCFWEFASGLDWARGLVLESQELRAGSGLQVALGGEVYRSGFLITDLEFSQGESRLWWGSGLRVVLKPASELGSDCPSFSLGPLYRLNPPAL